MSKSAAVFVIRDADMVLMEWRDDHPFNGKLSFPGGKIEDGECPEQAVNREMREEVGIAPRHALALAPIRSGSWTIYPFLITHYEGGLPEETDAGAELFWIHLDEACEAPWAPAREIAGQVRALGLVS